MGSSVRGGGRVLSEASALEGRAALSVCPVAVEGGGRAERLKELARGGAAVGAAPRVGTRPTSLLDRPLLARLAQRVRTQSGQLPVAPLRSRAEDAMRGEGGGGGGEGGDGRPEDGLVPRTQSRAALAPRHALARQREGGGRAAQRSARARRLLLVLGRDDAEEGRGARRLRSRRLAISLCHRLERERQGQRTSLREASRPHQPCNLHPRPESGSHKFRLSSVSFWRESGAECEHDAGCIAPPACHCETTVFAPSPSAQTRTRLYHRATRPQHASKRWRQQAHAHPWPPLSPTRHLITQWIVQ